jgi:hypothetical protein
MPAMGRPGRSSGIARHAGPALRLVGGRRTLMTNNPVMPVESSRPYATTPWIMCGAQCRSIRRVRSALKPTWCSGVRGSSARSAMRPTGPANKTTRIFVERLIDLDMPTEV